MRIFFVGDVQAHEWSTFGTIDVDGVNSRLKDVVVELRRIFKLAKKRKVQNVFILGDIFQDRDKLSVIVTLMLKKVLRQFRKRDIEVFLLKGNHDRTSIGNFSSIDLLSDVATIITEPQHVKLDSAVVLAIPFLPDDRDVLKSLDMCDNDDAIILHVGIRDAGWNEGIHLKNIPKNIPTFIGHDHTHKRLRKHVWYVGSMLHVNWSDQGQEKVIAELNTKTHKVKWHKTKGPEFTTIFLETIDTHIGDLTNKFVRVLWSGSFGEISKVRDKVRKAGAIGVEVTPSVIAAITSQQDTEKKTMKLTKLLKKQIKQLPKKDRQETMILGQEILNEAIDESYVQKSGDC